VARQKKAPGAPRARPAWLSQKKERLNVVRESEKKKGEGLGTGSQRNGAKGERRLEPYYCMPRGSEKNLKVKRRGACGESRRGT